MVGGLVMKKNKTLVSIFLVIMTVAILGATLYMSGLLSSPVSPTQIQKTKAAPISYTKKVDLFPTQASPEPTKSNIPTEAPSVTKSPTSIPTITKIPTSAPTIIPTKALLAQAPTLTPAVSPIVSPTVLPTLSPTSVPTKVPTTPLPSVVISPSKSPTPTTLPTPTLSPLLAYKSTSVSPTLAPTKSINQPTDPTKAPTPTKKIQPTGIQQLPETGWIQTSSILFIVAASTILFSLLF